MIAAYITTTLILLLAFVHAQVPFTCSVRISTSFLTISQGGTPSQVIVDNVDLSPTTAYTFEIPAGSTFVKVELHGKLNGIDAEQCDGATATQDGTCTHAVVSGNQVTLSPLSNDFCTSLLSQISLTKMDVYYTGGSAAPSSSAPSSEAPSSSAPSSAAPSSSASPSSDVPSSAAPSSSAQDTTEAPQTTAVVAATTTLAPATTVQGVTTRSPTPTPATPASTPSTPTTTVAVRSPNGASTLAYTAMLFATIIFMLATN
jgi:hypothetical protein